MQPELLCKDEEWWWWWFGGGGFAEGRGSERQGFLGVRWDMGCCRSLTLVVSSSRVTEK